MISENRLDCLFLVTKSLVKTYQKLSAAEIISLRDDAFNRYHNYKPFLNLIEKKFGKIAANNIVEMTKIKLKRKIKGDLNTNV